MCIRDSAKGDEFGLGQTIIALGKLLAQHLGILRTNIIETISLVRDADAFLKLSAVGCHVHEGQLKFDGAVEEVQKTAPLDVYKRQLKDRSCAALPSPGISLVHTGQRS